MSRAPDLSIITVNWKVADLVGELLGSIEANKEHLAIEMFVVDNDSKDGIDAVVAAFKNRSGIPITLIKNDRNLGFAAANNIAIRRASGRHVALLNPDARATHGALAKMVAWMDAHPDVGVAGTKLLNVDGTLQESVRRFPGLLDQAMILLKLQHVWPDAPPFKKYLMKGFDDAKEQDVDQVMGAAFFVRRETFKKIGLLDEAFFIWFEEVDFCKRVKNAGLRVVYTPVASFIHHRGASFAQAMTFKKQRYFTNSMRIYFAKHMGLWTTPLLALPMCFGLVSSAFFSLWHSPSRKA
ncbi:MAG: glycosyltransferase family 2 protein [Patescibacteria group bacterium]|nr:MAG: glycosyltransferase family 2 protein [Patescibacteria group bacterium]